MPDGELLSRATFMERLVPGVMRRSDAKSDGGVLAGIKSLTQAASLAAYLEAGAPQKT